MIFLKFTYSSHFNSYRVYAHRPILHIIHIHTRYSQELFSRWTYNFVDHWGLTKPVRVDASSMLPRVDNFTGVWFHIYHHMCTEFLILPYPLNTTECDWLLHRTSCVTSYTRDGWFSTCTLLMMTRKLIWQHTHNEFNYNNCIPFYVLMHACFQFR